MSHMSATAMWMAMPSHRLAKDRPMPRDDYRGVATFGSRV
jgi:hypothetical protein